MQRKIFAHIALSMILGCTAFSAFDEPNFDSPLFARDGVSLSDSEKDSVVNALNAIGANADFDADLKEKAIGLALILAPLDPASRKAIETLIKGAALPPVENAPTPRTSADFFWKTGLDLLKGPPSPDDATLATLLMELSLTIDPSPAADRVWRLGELTSYKTQIWEPFIKPQAKPHPSSLKIAELYAALQNPVTPEAPPKEKKKKVLMETPPAAATPAAPPAATGPVSEIKIQSGRIATVLSHRVAPVPLYVHLDIREPSTDEGSLFSVFTPDGTESGAFEMRLLAPQDLSVELRGLEKAITETKSKYPRWPDKKIAQLSLSNASGKPLTSLDGGALTITFPLSVLLEQTFSGNAISSDFVVMGPPQDVEAAVKAASAFGNSAKCLIPTGSLAAMLDVAFVKGDIADFVAIQLLEVESLTETEAILTGKSALPVTEAATEFREFLSAKPENLTVSEYAKNEDAISYLKTFIAKYPFHLSGRLMHDFGTTKPTTELLTKRAVEQIDALLKPFSQHYSDAIDPAGGTVEDLSGEFQTASTALRTLRNTIPTEAVQYLKNAQDVLESMEKFLAIKNKTTSTGEQRHEELKTAIQKFNTERQRLGIL